MDLMKIVAPPLIGGIIGYVTNDIAIRMLFRPLKPVMIGRFRVPFTPGIVPKRKNELAAVLGKAIVEQFFCTDDLEIIFTSDSFMEAVADSIVTAFDDPDLKPGFLNSEHSKYNEILKELKDELCVRILAAILKSDLSMLISVQGGRIAKERFSGSVSGKVLNETAFALISVPLAEQIKKYLLENGRSAIMPLIDEEFSELSHESIRDIIEKFVPDKDVRLNLIRDVYARFMKTHVRAIAESIDIGGMITEKVRQMEDGEVEKLVLTVVRRELRYVVLLGALLGIIIGAVNIFI